MDKYMVQAIIGVFGCIAVSIACWKSKRGLPLFGLLLVGLMVASVN